MGRKKRSKHKTRQRRRRSGKQQQQSRQQQPRKRIEFMDRHPFTPNVPDAKSRFQQVFLGAGLDYTASDIRYETKPADEGAQGAPNCRWMSSLHLPCDVHLCSHGCRTKKAAENQVASLALALWTQKVKPAILRALSKQNCAAPVVDDVDMTQDPPIRSPARRAPICDTIDLTKKRILPAYWSDHDDDSDGNTTEDYEYSDDDSDWSSSSDEDDPYEEPRRSTRSTESVDPRTARMTAQQAELLQVAQVFDRAKEQMEKALELVQAVIERHQQQLIDRNA